MRALLVVVALAGALTARAEPFWDRPRRTGLSLGIGLVVNLGPLADCARFGVAAEGVAEWVWLDRPYYHPTGSQLSPALRASIQMGWTHPLVFSGLAVQAGGVYADGFDGGYQHWVGLLGGGGLGMATDGFAGPFVTGTVPLPWSQVRFEAGRWRGDWHAPRLSAGPQLMANCCLFYD